MLNILDYYQHIPLHIDPIVFSIGSFSIRWYSLAYLVGFVVVYFLLRYRIGHDISNNKFSIFNFQFSISQLKTLGVQQEMQVRDTQCPALNNLVFDFLLFAMAGAVIGGRLGYVFLYNFSYFWHNPLMIISPYDFFSGKFIGIYGMSYHGGLLGIVAVTWIFTKKKKIDFWQWADFVVPAIPAGYFFGRIGNFLNLELYGRATSSWLGMYFHVATGSELILRYPSQLLEALFEGLVLFAVLWSVRNRNFFSGFNLVVYLIGYGLARSVVEFFREPDAQIGFVFAYFTLGQILSLSMIFIGGLVYFRRRKINAIMK